MNKDTILSTDLLDIIFENRNKDYGAYNLRKSYNKHVRIALLFMMILSLLLWMISLLKTSTKDFERSIPVILSPDIALSDFPPVHANKKSVAKISPLVKKTFLPDAPPKIVAFININKLPATPPEILSSSIQSPGSEINFTGSNDGQGYDNKLSGASAKDSITKKINKSPLYEAEVMPQYPGGVKALLQFLQSNLHSPEDIGDRDEVSVRVKFVVNYDGKLESFEVLESGGDAFDKEVVRVLKKMPLWIPGKSNGENVSVYYVVPVKFKSGL
ncbi:MAG: TonB family protein [Ginsengibacter sp.]